MITLTEVNEENFENVLSLKPKKEQEAYLPQVSYFLARAYINLKNNYPDCCFAILHQNTVIGFTKIVLVPKKEAPLFLSEDSYLLDAFLIDEKYQGKKLGNAAFHKLLTFMKAHPMGEVSKINLMCYPQNIAALHLYESFGFKQLKDPPLENKEILLLEKLFSSI